MVSVVRKAGRDVKRYALLLRRSLATSRHKAAINTKLNWKEFWQGRTRLWSYPRHIQVGTNLTCNLQCIFCRRQHPEERKRLEAIPSGEKEMSLPVISKLLHIAPYAEIVNITPYGDPLVFTRLHDFLKKYQQLGCRNLALTTNGALLDDAKAELIVRTGVHIVFLSIDSCDPATYRQLRKGAELERVIEGIDRINAWKERLHSPTPRLFLAATLMRRNIEELPSMIDFCRKKQFEEISVQMMEVEVPEMEPESLQHFRNLTKSMLTLAQNKAQAAGVRYNLHLALRNLMAERENTAPTAPGNDETGGKQVALTELCHYPWYFIYLDTNGDVRPCCYASVCWGNLEEQEFEEVWNGAAALSMRRSFLDNVVPAACRDKHCRVDKIIRDKE